MIELSGNISNYILKNFGEDYLKNYTEYFNSEYKPFLRISQLTLPEDKIISNLAKYGVQLEKVKNIPYAYRIMEGSSTTGKTLDFILGAYYIQSLSSMIPTLVLNPDEHEKVLDLCAAPGSKTTQLAELMQNKGTLIANEISLDRMRILMFNIDKMKLVNTGVMNNKGELLSKTFENYFDKILVDAPCSALGITQKKGEVSNWWNLKKAEGLSEIQMRLLVSAVKMAKIGGEIVYSTCTLTLEENELVLNKILKKYPVELVEIELPVESVPAFTKFEDEELNKEISKARRILPWQIGSEGFFVSKLRKIDNAEPVNKHPRKEKKLELLKSSSGKIKKYLDETSAYFGIERSVLDNYKYLLRSGDIYFVDKNWDCGELESFARIGSKFGSIDKRENLQMHTLAAQILGSYASKNLIKLEIKKELETYLNGGTIKKNFEAAGQQLIRYEDYILGTGTVSKEGLKSQFPRAFRTQEILLPE